MYLLAIHVNTSLVKYPIEILVQVALIENASIVVPVSLVPSPMGDTMGPERSSACTAATQDWRSPGLRAQHLP